MAGRCDLAAQKNHAAHFSMCPSCSTKPVSDVQYRNLHRTHSFAQKKNKIKQTNKKNLISKPTTSCFWSVILKGRGCECNNTGPAPYISAVTVCSHHFGIYNVVRWVILWSLVLTLQDTASERGSKGTRRRSSSQLRLSALKRPAHQHQQHQHAICLAIKVIYWGEGVCVCVCAPFLKNPSQSIEYQ